MSLAPLVVQHNILRISFKKRLMWWVFLWLLIRFLGNNKGAKHALAPLVAQHNFLNISKEEVCELCLIYSVLLKISPE